MEKVDEKKFLKINELSDGEYRTCMLREKRRRA